VAALLLFVRRKQKSEVEFFFKKKAKR